ncbi:MAG: hypothetical protein IKE60_26445 [Reyranella sp.]|uniref:hypothetical protein n=1 Tax=Reyranella sp. TaxID=1929291 RepID=UPI0025D32D32|nr:hypothetical protein [Reyranella sp.]MBR2818230.1 hypothetical protein [Reyranella sp.]
MAEAKTKKTKTEEVHGQTDAQDPALMDAAIRFTVALLTRHGMLRPTATEIASTADAAVQFAKAVTERVRAQ